MCTYCGVREYVFDRDPVKQFIDLVFTKRKTFKHIICIAHNAHGFDSQIILKYIVERGDSRVKPSVILNGTKIILMEIMNVKFLDSLNYLHKPLSALPKAYGLREIEKGTFPHLFNIPENQNYIGKLPPLSSYSPDTMSIIERTKFLEWYNDQKIHGYIFDFQKQILKYCKQDVNILRLACLALRETSLNCSIVDPFTEAATIASSCLRVYRKNFLKPNTAGVIPQGGYRRVNNQSVKALLWLKWMEKVMNCEIQHADRCHEKRLPEGPIVDGFLSPHQNNTQSKGVVLQFHGCYWHGCPRCYPVNRYTRLVVGNETMNDRYERTCEISEKIRSCNYYLIEKWECEYEKECLENESMRQFV